MLAEEEEEEGASTLTREGPIRETLPKAGVMPTELTLTTSLRISSISREFTMTDHLLTPNKEETFKGEKEATLMAMAVIKTFFTREGTTILIP